MPSPKRKRLDMIREFVDVNDLRTFSTKAGGGDDGSMHGSADAVFERDVTNRHSRRMPQIKQGRHIKPDRYRRQKRKARRGPDFPIVSRSQRA